MLVIVGSGLAGYTVAREVRKRDRAMPVTLITADGGEMYAKPMLSNAIRQNKTPDALAQKTAGQVAAELGIQVRPRSRVAAIDRAGRRLRLADGETVAYDRLVLAVGADARPYRPEGSDRVPVASVNDLDDYRRWRADLVPGGRVLLVGGGLIGCEFADDLAAGGIQVTVVDPGRWPLERLLPAELGGELRQALEGAGVRLHFGRSVGRLEPAGEGGIAHLDDGTAVPFHRALSAIGLLPRTALAEAAGVAVDRGGIVVDRALRTSDPAIFALGDCALTAAGPLPYVQPLMAGARALAATLTGAETPLHLPAMPVVVKTTSLPVVACPPPFGAQGVWRVEGEGEDRTALFLNPDGKALGFALTGAHAPRHRQLGPTMPDLLPPAT